MTDREKLEKLKKLADAMYYAAKYLTTDASRLHKAMDEYHKFIIHECKEEPVSEGLGEAIEQSFIYHENRGDDFRCDEQIETSYRYGFETGANWQKEQLLAKAVDAVVKIDAGGYPYIDSTIELYDYDKDIPLAKRGDKVKIIVIRES